ncbi:hypothetical protein ACFU6S_10670 [Streptomyces sp. NPDC057456]|uniref:hypothetical protein n=1 Tax=Streptomyces sp. NPDC057456 TaxID=3346139 RepID=UPI0036B4446E
MESDRGERSGPVEYRLGHLLQHAQALAPLDEQAAAALPRALRLLVVEEPKAK